MPLIVASKENHFNFLVCHLTNFSGRLKNTVICKCFMLFIGFMFIAVLSLFLIDR